MCDGSRIPILQLCITCVASVAVTSETQVTFFSLGPNYSAIEEPRKRDHVISVETKD